MSNLNSKAMFSTTQLLIAFLICIGITFLIGLSGSGIGYKERFVLIKNEVVYYRMFMGTILFTCFASFCFAGYLAYAYLPRLSHCISSFL